MTDGYQALNLATRFVLALPTWFALVSALMVITSEGLARKVAAWLFGLSQPLSWIAASAISYTSYVLFLPNGAYEWRYGGGKLGGGLFEVVMGSFFGLAAWITGGLWMEVTARMRRRARD